MAQRLSDAHARNAKAKSKAYKLADGRGLYLLVQPNGSRFWRYKYRLNHVENVFAIGRYPDMGLQQAREARQRANELVIGGINPAHARAQDRLRDVEAKRHTFGNVATEWIDRHAGKWSEQYLKKVRTVLTDEVFPKIGKVQINSVTANQLLSIVKEVENRGAKTVALLVRQWCSAVFRYAISTLRADSDPAAALKGAIDRPRTVHKRALSAVEIAAFVSRLKDASGDDSVRIGLELLLLTFVRPGELRGALWSEFDLPAGYWRISASRMKMRSPHIVPLSTQAVVLLKRLESRRSDCPHLFPNARDEARIMSSSTFNRFLERMNYKGHLSAHAFRATASTLLNEMGYNKDLIERQLAHQERDKVRASYNHADYLAERKQMMQDWANFVDLQRLTKSCSSSHV